MKSVSLKDVCQVFGDGDWIESKDQSDGGIRLVQTGNIGVGVFKDRIEKARWISEVTFKKLRCTEILEGDVLVSRLPDPVGRSCLIPALEHKAITAVDCSILRFDPKKIIAKFFVFYSQSSQYANAIEPLISGSTRQRISREKLGTIQIPLPSLDEQLDIVEKLDSAIAEIEDAKMRTNASLQNLSKLLDSKFEEVFTILEAEFGVVQSGTIIDVRDGTHDSPSYVDSGYPLITSKNLQDGLIDFSKVSLITEEDYQQINKRSKVEAGDLLFAMIGTIGNPVVVKEDPLFAIKNVALFKGNPSYEMTFLSFYLRTPKIREKFEREAKGTTQRFLGLGYLRTLDIPNVPPENQLEIVRKLEQFESEIKKLELNLKQRLENFIELNNSIVSSMFTIDSEEEAVA